MSLILDALRKADSERERGSVPGLHAHPLPALAAEPAQASRKRAWQWALAGLAVAGALAWYVAARDAGWAPAESPPPKAVPGAGRASAPTTTPTTAPTTTAATRAAAALARGELPPAAEPAPWPARESRGAARSAAEPATAEPATAALAATAPATAEPGRTAPAGTSRATPAPTAGTPRPGAQASVAPAVASPSADARPPAEAGVYAVEQLPQHIRSQLPALSVTGAIYSPNAADRTLIVNGRLVREKQSLAADLSLEQIGQKSAVLSFRGYRFELRF